MPTGHFWCPVSTWPLTSPFANSFSEFLCPNPYSHSLPTSGRVEISSPNPLSGFAPKQTKESSAWQTHLHRVTKVGVETNITFVADDISFVFHRKNYQKYKFHINSESFFQAAVVLVLLYGCTTQTLTKHQKKKLDGNDTRMLRAILNKFLRQHPTKCQLYGQLPPIPKTIQVRWTRHAGHCWRSRDELISDVVLWTPTYGRAKAGRPARTYIQQLCEDSGCSPEDLPEAIGRSGKRGSGISVLVARHNDEDDNDLTKSLSGQSREAQPTWKKIFWVWY